jgi:hypothetical protein
MGSDELQNDEQQITAAALDYFEGWYDADAGRMDRALHPNLVKRSPADVGKGTVLTKTRMVELTGAGAGRNERTGEPNEIRVLDIHRDMALVLARSGPYREYLHLLRDDAGWRLAGALWDEDDPR